MIIVEGPDGAGKTNLINRLGERFQLDVHPKFVHSTDYAGTAHDLFSRACRDVVEVHKDLLLYDRHPLISEYVYGPIIRGEFPARVWTGPIARQMVNRLAAKSFVVWCRPSNERLRSSVSDERDMAGVSTLIDTIAGVYDTLSVMWPGLNTIKYDYANKYDLDGVYNRIQLFVAQWRKNND